MFDDLRRDMFHPRSQRVPRCTGVDEQWSSLVKERCMLRLAN